MRFAKLSQTSFRAAAVAAVLALGATGVWASAEKGIVQNRIDRLNRVEEESRRTTIAETEVWSRAKIRVNFEYRCPVADALGYFAAYDPSRLSALEQRVRPLLKEMQDLAAARKFVGTKFPEELEPRLRQMQRDLFTAIDQTYGYDARMEFVQYLNVKWNEHPVGDISY